MTVKDLLMPLYKKKKWTFLLLAGFAGVVIYWYHGNETLPEKDLPRVVETLKAQPGNMIQTVRLIGTINPKHNTILYAKTSGPVDIVVSSGQKVKKGTLIANIINEDVKKNYQLSKETKTITEQKYQRLQQIKKQGYISLSEIGSIKQSYLDAQKELARTKIEYEKLHFYAPFDGVVGAYKIKDGAQISEGKPVVVFYDPKSLSVDVDVPCTNLPPIQAHQKAIIHQKMYELTHYQNMVDENTHMCPADIDIRCPECLIGSSVDVELVVAEQPSVIQIPYEAIFIKEGRSYVYKIVDNKVQLTAVKTGMQQKNMVAITDGLMANDRVVIKGTERLYQGLAVDIGSSIPNHAHG